MNQIALTKPQFRLVTTDAKFPAFVGGFGSGKTHALTTRAMMLKSRYPKQNIAYYLPTFDLVRNIAFPRFAEALENVGARYSLNKTFATIEIEGGGNIIFRTMDNPERIVGYEVADSLLDEIDTLPMEQARMVWQKVIARNRQKKPDGAPNTVAVGTTPEGFRFVYETWGKDPACLEKGGNEKGYELIKASTYSNAANLPEGYIESLVSTYPTNLIAAYLDGEFVNLAAGSVYPEFDRKLNGTTETVKSTPEYKEHLHIGMDFNVGNMSAVVGVLRGGDPHAVDEFTKILDTPAMITAIKARYEGHAIFVYPDASGQSRKSNNASESDVQLLRAAGFTVLVNRSNPAVKDRILSVNQLICSRSVGLGKNMRRLRVNIDMCPMLTECLEKQPYDKNGEPDKKGGLDHLPDALGYMINHKWPVAGRGMLRLVVSGV